MSYVLHYAPDNASLIVRLALEEMDLPYRAVLVDRGTRAQDGTAYRALNPAGLIPALETPQGVMFETAAILLWLADTHGKMAPRADAPDRAAFLSTLFFVSNTLHAQMRMLFYPWKYVGDDQDAQDRLRQKLTTSHATDMSIPGGLALLNDYYQRRPAASGTTPAILDYYAAALIRWCAIYPAGWAGWLDMGLHPALNDVITQLEGRRAVTSVAKAEGLGPHPFTAPQLPNPPEGSAL